ncbi:hypothetical protein [Chroococcidiopsis thermalis]|jgi:hypothetical protein|uniref:Uncharacterized protein n=1 Tax=Chroococcidiopsis thermalis (strain PCC 7203) TaxID=251229 RepID=K9U264_CHRTP|nr:hypothetical protein [Chroococcidiopsis thermalis]AFY89192.1 hypothetical protein Chro_3759 [Chroococcidiopsis thermalis PCC 7203]
MLHLYYTSELDSGSVVKLLNGAIEVDWGFTSALERKHPKAMSENALQQLN